MTNSPGATRGGGPGGPGGGGGQHTGVSTPVGADQKLAEVPAGLFYPFFPESTVVPDGGTPGPGAAGPGGARGGAPGQVGSGANGGTSNGTPVGGANGGNGGGDYTQILAQAAAQQGTGQWGAPSQESYMLEEKDVSMSHHSHSGNMSVHMWSGGAPFTPMGQPGA